LSQYIISSVRHFNNIEKTADKEYFYKQTATLDFNYSNHNLHQLTFKGTYYGAFYYLENISYGTENSSTIGDTEGTSYIGGMFGINEGVITLVIIKNLKIVINKSDNEGNIIRVGGIAGKNSGGIHLSFLRESNILIHRMKAYVGGLVGENATIINPATKKDYPSYNILLCLVEDSKIMSNGDTGGIAGQNFGGIMACNITAKTVVMLYQITTNNKSLGGIVGYNYLKGLISDCTISGKVEYDPNTPASNSKLINPYIGLAAGQNSGGTVSGCNLLGSIKTGALRTVDKHDQKKYVDLACKDGVGR
jgi:hypothetical protein